MTARLPNRHVHDVHEMDPGLNSQQGIRERIFAQDKFERHLVAVAQKCQEQDDAVEFALQQIDEAEEQLGAQTSDVGLYWTSLGGGHETRFRYKQRVAKIQEGLGDAEGQEMRCSRPFRRAPSV